MNRFERAKAYTQKYKDILKPCRYCGNTDIRIVSERSIFSPRNLWAVCCSTHACDCTADYTSVREAVKAWNEKQQQVGRET